MSKKKTEKFIEFWKPYIEKEMEDRVDSLEGVSVLKEAVSYALFSGGKRVRPLFYLALVHSIHPVNQEWDWEPSVGEPMLQVACSFEYFHAFTLIQDDLPCMDNDALRRGKPSLWKKFGESTALLASNVLLGMSYVSGIYTEGGDNYSDTSYPFSEMLMPDSVIGGQALDLGLQKGVAREKINYMKTAHFFEKMAYVAESECRHDYGKSRTVNRFKDLPEFAVMFGAYFQHRDDYFDSVTDFEKNESKKKMEQAMEHQNRLLKKMDLQDSVLGGFASWLIDKE